MSSIELSASSPTLSGVAPSPPHVPLSKTFSSSSLRLNGFQAPTLTLPAQAPTNTTPPAVAGMASPMATAGAQLPWKPQADTVLAGMRRFQVLRHTDNAREFIFYTERGPLRLSFAEAIFFAIALAVWAVLFFVLELTLVSILWLLLPAVVLLWIGATVQEGAQVSVSAAAAVLTISLLERMLVVRDLGIQFIDRGRIADVIINEGIRHLQVVYYLAIVVTGETNMIVAFSETLPRLDPLLRVYRSTRACLFGDAE